MKKVFNQRNRKFSMTFELQRTSKWVSFSYVADLNWKPDGNFYESNQKIHLSFYKFLL